MTESNDKPKNAEKDAFQEILNYIEKTDLEEIRIEKEGKKVMLRRSPHGVKAGPAAAAAQVSEIAAAEVPRTLSIRSPIVGRFYRSTGADRPPFVVEGGKVVSGQKVAVVEAMKIKKEVFSNCTGKVARILPRDGDPVEYGQELFAVEPEEEKTGD